MNRSVQLTQFGISGMEYGQLLVGPFRHPARGVVEFPAAPAVAARLRAERHVVAHPPEPVQPATGRADGTLHTASYIDRSGRVIGLAVAAHNDDTAGLIAARRTVATWSAIWRTRRIVVPGPGRCHPDEAGRPCVHEHDARAELTRFAARGDHAVVIGRTTAAGQDRDVDGISVVATPADVAALPHLPPEHVSYLIRPGYAVELASPVIEALRARFPRIRMSNPDTICYRPSDDRGAIQLVVTSTDTVLTAAPLDPEDTWIRELARLHNTPLHETTKAADVHPEWLSGAASIGIITPRTADPAAQHALITVLSGLGPVSVVRRAASTEVVTSEIIPSTATTGLPTRHLPTLLEVPRPA